VKQETEDFDRSWRVKMCILIAQAHFGGAEPFMECDVLKSKAFWAGFDFNPNLCRLADSGYVTS
jgi:hypothetical protein